MRSVFLSALIFCAVAAQADAERLLIGHWAGFGDDLENPYVFDTVHCASGQLAVAISRDEQDTQIYFGTWQADGATVSHDFESRVTYESQNFEVVLIEMLEVLNLYHFVELTERRMIYEWRGRSTRRFEAQKTTTGSGISTKDLTNLACNRPPSLS